MQQVSIDVILLFVLTETVLIGRDDVASSNILMFDVTYTMELDFKEGFLVSLYLNGPFNTFC